MRRRIVGNLALQLQRDSHHRVLEKEHACQHATATVSVLRNRTCNNSGVLACFPQCHCHRRADGLFGPTWWVPHLALVSSVPGLKPSRDCPALGGGPSEAKVSNVDIPNTEIVFICIYIYIYTVVRTRRAYAWLQAYAKLRVSIVESVESLT